MKQLCLFFNKLLKGASFVLALFSVIAGIVSCNEAKVRDIKVPSLDKVTTKLIEPACAVPQTFLEKYPSITDGNLEAFMEDWKEWSLLMQEHSRSETVDSIMTRVFKLYPDTIDTDTSIYTILPYCVRVSCYSLEFTQKRYASDIYGLQEEKFVFPNFGWTGSCAVVPMANTGKSVLYITGQIRDKLARYTGGIYLNGDKRVYTESEGTFMEIDKDNLARLGHYTNTARGHWGNYWHFQSMPTVYQIHLFPNGTIVMMRNNYAYGEDIFMHEWSDRIDVLSYWQE